MSAVAKFLMVTIGGGLLLGTIGGQLANPVVLERAGEKPWREQPHADIAASNGVMAEAPPPDPNPYGGRYSYAPAFADEAIEIWPDPYMDPDGMDYEYTYEWPEPPTIVELDAWLEEETPETRVHGRRVDLPPPSTAHSIATSAERAADAAEDAAETDGLPQEPRVADGQLPAIW